MDAFWYLSTHPWYPLTKKTTDLSNLWLHILTWAQIAGYRNDFQTSILWRMIQVQFLQLLTQILQIQLFLKLMNMPLKKIRFVENLLLTLQFLPWSIYKTYQISPISLDLHLNYLMLCMCNYQSRSFQVAGYSKYVCDRVASAITN